jgi:GNAT superfamily N-acetyltransferase
MPDVRPSTPDDWPLLADIAAQGFSDDPLMTWVFQDDDTRLAQLTTLFGGLSRDMVSERGHAFVCDDACTALWRSPGWASDADEGEDDGAPSPFAPDELVRLGQLGEATRAAHPHEPHWYLNVLATRPDRRGRGLGARTLAPVLATCDADGMPAYLESSNPRNLSLYRRHGFVETGLIPLPDGPSLTPMWRDPR